MIGSIFRLKHQIYVERYKYDLRYVNYFTTKIIYENKGLTSFDFYNLCEKEFGSAVSKTGIKSFLEDNFRFDEEKNKYYASIEQASYFDLLYRIFNLFYCYQNNGSDFILNALNESFKSYNKDLINLISLFFAYNNLNEQKNEEHYMFIAYDIISNFEDYSKYIDEIFKDLLIDKNKEISLLIKDNNMLQLLNNNSIYLVSDLDKLSNEEIVALFAEDIRNLKKKIELLSLENIGLHIENLVNDYFEECCQNDKNLEMFKYRNGISCEEHSLEETGQIEGLTRERVRQICAKIEERLEINFDKIKFDLDYFFNDITKNGNIFLIKSDLNKYINNDLAINELCFLCNLLDFDIYYDKEYKFFFNKYNLNIETIIKDTLEKFGLAVNKNLTLNFSEFERNVFKNNFKVYSNNENLYIKKGFTYIDVVIDTIDKNFPDGYKLDDESAYQKLLEFFKNKYGLECETSKRGIDTDILRHNYCYIDRGKVKNRKFLNPLPEDLIIDINNYLAQKGGIVYYSSIFEDFKDRLEELGINNRYHLKGLLDDYLLESFAHKRDYIVIENDFDNPFKSIKNEINSYNGVVYLKDFRNKYNGVKDYVFINYVSQIEGVVWLKYNEEFILLKNMSISESTINLIDENINYLFKSLNEKVIHTSKLYARLKIMHSEIFNELPLIKDSFSLFSLVSVIFKDKYKFRRPYISCDENLELSKSAILNNFIFTQQKINPDIIENYLSKMHLTQLYSYLNLLIDISDSFVQVNKNTAYKKELLEINDSQLEELKYELNYYINSFGPIDTRKYNDYINLPKLKIGWNKYLLVGIVRTYFSDYYSIKYTETTYDATDFIIGRYK